MLAAAERAALRGGVFAGGASRRRQSGVVGDMSSKDW